MIVRVIFIFCWIVTTSLAHAQKKVLNIPGIHQLVGQNKEEHRLQVKARDKQLANTTNERLNLTHLDRLKNRYRELQQRFQTLGLLVNLADITLYARPMVSRILANQQAIIKLARASPSLVAIGYPAQLEFAAKAESLLTYALGLSLSAGDINQMKPSDRKVLFDFMLTELSNLQDLSNNMLAMMQHAASASRLRNLNPFQQFIDMDIALGREILENAPRLP